MISDSMPIYDCFERRAMILDPSTLSVSCPLCPLACGADRKLLPVPDIDNKRWCRACQKMLPVSAFPTGKRRYLCRKHMWTRCSKSHKERKMSDSRKWNVYRLWRRCWEDSRVSFGQSRISLIERDISKLICIGTIHVPNNTDIIDKVSNHFAIMPLDPLLVLSPENSVLVEMAARKELLRVWKTVGSKGYSTTLAQMRSKDCADCGIDQRSQSQSEEVTKFECQL